MRLRITEIGKNAIAHIARDDSLVTGDDLGDVAMKARHELAHVFRIKVCRQRTRADQIAKHHGQLPSLGTLPSQFDRKLRRVAACPLQFGDRTQHLPAVPQQHTELLEIALSQIGKNGQIDRILGEALRVLSETKRPQPLGDILHWKGSWHLTRGSSSCPARACYHDAGAPQRKPADSSRRSGRPGTHACAPALAPARNNVLACRRCYALVPSPMEDPMCWEIDYKFFAEQQKKAQEAKIKQEQRAGVIDRLLTEANEQREKTEETPVKEVAPAK